MTGRGDGRVDAAPAPPSVQAMTTAPAPPSAFLRYCFWEVTCA
jgi:hypothetical protein